MPNDPEYAAARDKNLDAAKKMAGSQAGNLSTPSGSGAAALAKQVTGGTANDIARINASRAGFAAPTTKVFMHGPPDMHGGGKK